MKEIKIINERIGTIKAKLLEGRNPKTVSTIWESLPFEAHANTWGDEIYFSIRVIIEEENAQEIVEAGDVGYWPPGRGFCIFFGPTPISRGEVIRPADPVNVFGRTIGDPKVFRRVKEGDRIRVERSE